MLTDLRGDAFFLFTPNGVQHFTHTLFRRGLDPFDAEWKSWQKRTHDNPFIDRAEIESMRAGMSELAFRQEVLGEFCEWSGSVFRKIDKAILTEPILEELKRWRPPHVMETVPRNFIVGCDWAGSGRGGDATVFCVMSLEDAIVYELDHMQAQEYALQRERLKALAWRYRPVIIQGERNAIGQPQLEAMRGDGVNIEGFVTQNQSKARIVEQVALALEPRS
jgi:hypothetical protein